MNDEQLLRYSRQIMLPEIDIAGQLKLANATVIIVGLGGLGSAAAMYLAAAGVGHLVLVDYDTVDLSNLQRQIVHTLTDIDRLKVESARDTLHRLNPDTRLTLVNRQLDLEELISHAKGADVILDATDNFRTRFLLNEASVQTRTPLVSAAAIRFEAQVTVFDPRHDDSPCYRCLYGEDAATEETCTANGVIAPLLGIIGSIEAIETMKIIMGLGETLQGRLLLLDAMTMEWHEARLRKDPACPVCSGRR